MKFKNLTEWYRLEGKYITIMSMYKRSHKIPPMLGEASMADWFEYNTFCNFYCEPDSMYFIEPYFFESLVDYYDWQYGLLDF
jgi:hypothetical protein